MSHIKYRSKEVVQKRKRNFIRYLIFIVILFLILITSAIFLLRIDRIQIKNVEISGEQMISKEDLSTFINNTIQGSYLWVVPKTNYLLYNPKKTERDVLNQFPTIKSVSITRSDFQKLSVVVEERKPQSLWCEENETSDPQDCYFVDDTGFIFSKSPYFSGNVYFVYRGLLDRNEPIGAHVLPQKDFQDFESFLNLVKKLKLNVVSANIEESKDFDIVLSSGTKILFNSQISYDDIYSNLSSVLKSDQFASSTIDSLDYVDLRFGNKVFLKSKNSI